MWKKIDNRLYKSFKFKDFSEAFAFMTRVALLAEKADHHPTWKNEWNTVVIWLSSHDQGNSITEKDERLAIEIDKINELRE